MAKKKFSKGDGMWLAGMGITLIAGLWKLWTTEMSDPIMHIKLIYSIFITLIIFIAAYFIVFKLEDKKNGKRK